MKTKTYLNKFDKLMMAATFAEAGECDTAREIINEQPRKVSRKQNRINWFDRLMMAATFAEAGESDIAREIINDQPRKVSRKQNRRSIRTGVDHRPRLRA